MGKFNYQNFKFDYEPYPLGVAREFIEPEFYRRLVESFPPVELFDTFFDAGSNKKALVTSTGFRLFFLPRTASFPSWPKGFLTSARMWLFSSPKLRRRGKA